MDIDGTVQNGFSDISLPELVFGRETEKARLAEMIDVVCCEKTAICLVAGYAGIGKTALVRQLVPAVEKRNGLFVSGKFDQYHRDVPYSAIIEVFRNLVKQLLMRNDAELSLWRKRITKALYPNTQIIIDLVPELEYITGPQKKSSDCDPATAENRFNLCFTEFFKILACAHTPFVVFLDDIHWADSASLKMISHIIKFDPPPGLYMAGAYRENEVDDSHILVKAIRDIAGAETLFRHIRLDPLKPENMEEIINTLITADKKTVKKLSDILFRKTGGNPFFARKFMIALQGAGYLSRGRDSRWRLNVSAAETMTATENVTSLLAGTICVLPGPHQQILAAASFIGSSFNVDLLAGVLNISPENISSHLLKLVKQDLLIMENTGNFSFSHDRIQEAANNIPGEKEKAMLHYKIGDILARLSVDKERDTYIFEITDHFNEARDLFKSDMEVLELVKRNHAAGLKAKSNVAYEAAIRYYYNAISLLDSHPSVSTREILYFSHRNHAECLYLSGKFKQSETAVSNAMEYAVTDIEKADLYNILIMMNTINLKYNDAISYGITAMKLFRFELSLEPEMLMQLLTEEKIIVDRYLENITVDAITGLPECKREDIRLLLKILRNMAPPVFLKADMFLLKLIVLKTNSLSFCYGITPESISGFGQYGQILCFFCGEYNLGEILGKSSFILSKKYGVLSQIGEAGMRYGLVIKYWSSHLRKSQTYLTDALDAGLKAGDYVYAGWNILHIVFNTIALGEPLQKALQIIDSETLFFSKINDQVVIFTFLAYKKIYSSLADEDTEDLINVSINNDAFIKETGILTTLTPFVMYCLNKALVLYIYGNYNEALRYINKAEPLSHFVATTYHEIDIIFYKSLILCALFPNFPDEKQAIYYVQISETLAKLEAWAKQCPENFMYRYFFLKAEFTRLDGNIINTMRMYDSAINAAHTNKYRQFEAITCERAGLFWEENGKSDFAEIYLRRAFDCYRDWGALHKIKLLRHRYPGIFPAEENPAGEISSPEILSILKDFNSLSGCDDMDSLINEFSRIILNDTDVECFVLIIDKNDKNFFIKAGIKREKGKPSVRILECDENLKDDTDDMPVEILRYVRRTYEQILIDDREMENLFSGTPYIKKYKPLSIMCIQNGKQGNSVIFYLENRLKYGVFNEINKKKLGMLSRHAAMCLENALYRSGRWNTSGDSSFVFKSRGEIIKVPCELIIYISSHGRHSVVHTADSTLETAMLLGNIEKKLPANHFSRIHNQYIVNIQYISRIRSEGSGMYSIYLKDDDDTRLPVGRGYYNEFIGKFKPETTKYLS